MTINFNSFINKYKNQKSSLGLNYIISKTQIKEPYPGSWLKPPELKSVIDREFKKIVFGFNNSLIILNDGSIISYCTGNSVGNIFSYKKVLSFTIKESGFFSKGTIMYNSEKVGNLICNDTDMGLKIFKDFQKFLKENSPSLISEKKDNGTQKNSKSKTKEEVEQKNSKPKTKEKVGQKNSKPKTKKELVTTFISQTKEFSKYYNEKKETESKIRLKTISIINEKLLNSIPMNLEFSERISIKMKSLQDNFNDLQLNKLTRFLSHIEEKESNYNKLYELGCTSYIDDPNNPVFKKLPVVYFSILNYYQLITLMLNNYMTDKILFNKLYNVIEDEGIFMTRSEIETMEYLNDITNNLKGINNTLQNGFNDLILKFGELNKTNNEILGSSKTLENSLFMVDSSLGMIYDSLDDIYI